MNSLILALFACVALRTPSLGDSAPSDMSLAQQQAEQIVARTNEIRVKRGLKPLVPLGYLNKAALGHSKEMLELNYFSHTSPVAGRTKTKDRITAAGGSWRACAENIYRSQGHPIDMAAKLAVDALERSPSHFKNLISPNYTHIGVGIAVGDNQITVTQVFSKP